MPIHPSRVEDLRAMFVRLWPPHGGHAPWTDVHVDVRQEFVEAGLVEYDDGPELFYLTALGERALAEADRQVP